MTSYDFCYEKIEFFGQKKNRWIKKIRTALDTTSDNKLLHFLKKLRPGEKCYFSTVEKKKSLKQFIWSTWRCSSAIAEPADNLAVIG